MCIISWESNLSRRTASDRRSTLSQNGYVEILKLQTCEKYVRILLCTFIQLKFNEINYLSIISIRPH